MIKSYSVADRILSRLLDIPLKILDWLITKVVEVNELDKNNDEERFRDRRS